MKKENYFKFYDVALFSNIYSNFSSLGVGEQFNEKTSFLDASNIYGNSKVSIYIYIDKTI